MESDTAMTRVLGFDVSSHQDKNETARKIDFQQMSAAGGRFCIIRAVLAGPAKDEDYDYNWQAAGETDMLRGVYGHCDYRFHAKVSAQKLIDVTGGDVGDLGAWANLEAWGGYAFPASEPMQNWLDYYVKYIQDKIGHTVGLYTNPNYINLLKPVRPSVLALDLWGAYYMTTYWRLFGNLPTKRFAPWTTYPLWQYTDREDGTKYGVESEQIDANYFMGSYDELLSFCNRRTGAVIEQPVNVLHIAEYGGEYHVSVNDLADGDAEVICLPQDTDGYRMVQSWRDELK